MPATAETLDSVYTDLDLKACRVIEPSSEPEDGGRLECAGLPGIPVHVAEGDLRFFVGFGRRPEAQCAMTQTFAAFNSLGAKVEWRRADGEPFAAILRWHVTSGGEGSRKSWLVVTRLGPDTCHTAYVEGSSPEANALARKYADEFARGFDCRKDKPDISLKTSGIPDAGLPEPCR
ncbi:MAG: hypothetical protein AB7S41_02760 [Parvibaculaceae bacterium]